jgi:hypothetical protein
LKFFHTNGEQHSEERPPAPDPSPLPDAVSQEPVAAITLSPLLAAQLTHALGKKAIHPLKDLSIDGAKSKAVVGGLGQSANSYRRRPTDEFSDNPIV